MAGHLCRRPPHPGSLRLQHRRTLGSGRCAEAGISAAETDRALSTAFGFVRFGYLLAILLAAGGALFAAVVAPRSKPRFVVLALVLVIGSSVVGFFLQTAIAGNVTIAETTHGLVLGGKIALLLLTLPLANLNRTKTVPGIVAGDEAARRTMRRYVRIEIVLVLAVIALTAMLIETVPARHAAHKIKPPAGPVSESVKLPSGASARFTIDPGTVGPNAITVALRSAAGAPDATIDEVRLTGTLAKQRIDRLPIEIRRAGPPCCCAGETSHTCTSIRSTTRRPPA